MTSRRPQGAMIHARATVDRVNSVAAKETWVLGSILIDGIGEVVVDLNFPVLFGEEPLPMLGGGVLLSKEEVQRHNYPTVQGVVVGWHMDGTRYKGAQLAVVASGRPEQRVRMTFAFIGSALTNIRIDG
jgi:hypothetical protein